MVGNGVVEFPCDLLALVQLHLFDELIARRASVSDRCTEYRNEQEHRGASHGVSDTGEVDKPPNPNRTTSKGRCRRMRTAPAGAKPKTKPRAGQTKSDRNATSSSVPAATAPARTPSRRDRPGGFEIAGSAQNEAREFGRNPTVRINRA